MSAAASSMGAPRCATERHVAPFLARADARDAVTAEANLLPAWVVACVNSVLPAQASELLQLRAHGGQLRQDAAALFSLDQIGLLLPEIVLSQQFGITQGLSLAALLGRRLGVGRGGKNEREENDELAHGDSPVNGLKNRRWGGSPSLSKCIGDGDADAVDGGGELRPSARQDPGTDRTTRVEAAVPWRR
ncbi:MAG: hypothetical protein ACOZDY_00820 [Pseudomonadota bacterium]